MAQYLKDDVAQAITKAALEVFAQKGFRGATMAEIARRASISTGNIYRYFHDKETLFEALGLDEVRKKLEDLIVRRVVSLDGVVDVAQLPEGSAFHLASQDLVALCSQERFSVVLLLTKAQGTRFEGFARHLATRLTKMTRAHYLAMGQGSKQGRPFEFVLKRLYDNMIQTVAEALTELKKEPEIREALDAYSRYHLAGLNNLFS